MQNRLHLYLAPSLTHAHTLTSIEQQLVELCGCARKRFLELQLHLWLTVALRSCLDCPSLNVYLLPHRNLHVEVRYLFVSSSSPENDLMRARFVCPQQRLDIAKILALHWGLKLQGQAWTSSSSTFLHPVSSFFPYRYLSMSMHVVNVHVTSVSTSPQYESAIADWRGNTLSPLHISLAASILVSPWSQTNSVSQRIKFWFADQKPSPCPEETQETFLKKSFRHWRKERLINLDVL